MRLNMMRRGSRALAVAGVSALSVGLAACGSSGGSASAGASGSRVVNLVSIRDMTGVNAFTGKSAVPGSELAIDQINASNFLGATKLSLTVEDAAGSAETAASLATQAIASKKYAAILGPLLTNEAVAIAPIAQKGQLPVVFTQAGGDGVVIGNYTFRATADYPDYFDVMGKYLQAMGVKRLAVLYDASIDSYAQTATQVIPTWGAKFGIKVVVSKAVQTTTEDFSAPAAAIASAKPDAVAFFLIGSVNATFVEQLAQAGFQGPMISANGAGSGNLDGSGQAGTQVAWPTDFSASEETAAAKTFTAAYEAKFHQPPNNYAAEAYDATWFVARAMKVAGTSPSDVQKGLVMVTKQGFNGAEGHVTFDGNNEKITPIIVRWNGTKDVPVS
jgi:branched-chain amino acid transport system substrate-binding protein